MKGDGLSKDSQKFLEFDVQLFDYYEQCMEESDQDSVCSAEQVIDLMCKVGENGGCSNESELLSKVQSEDIRQYILNNPEYFLGVSIFLYSYGNKPQFDVYVKNVVSALRDLSQSENEDNAYKVNKTLKYLEKENKIKLQENI
ncbi:hypothetical protein MNB_SUP05-SYMBIONT-5-256 [hydrothermal vent metagenome]|uniref:Uncharacterized protein n=1 Tax=hydrothermal vent metagenome TaxID=652676 RepID=A0A1W1E5M1_9ZZZZ